MPAETDGQASKRPDTEQERRRIPDERQIGTGSRIGTKII